MAGRVAVRPRAVSSLVAVTVSDQATQRALDAIGGAVQKLQSGRERDVVRMDLVIGTNKVRHGLGRAPAGYTITPTVASAAFAHALDVAGPYPDREVWITVIGADQPGARIEVW